MWPNSQFPTDLITFIEEIVNGKLHFFVQWNVKSTNKNISENYLVSKNSHCIKMKFFIKDFFNKCD